MGCGGGAASPEAARSGVGARGGEFRGEAGLLTKSLRSAAEWQSDVARATKGFLRHAQASSTWALALYRSKRRPRLIGLVSYR